MPDPVAPGALVVLTGASGFIAKHVARQLLEDGYRVRATLRSPGRAEEVRAAVLPGLPPDAADRLAFAEADLLADRGWPEAMAGAAALVHTASPFPLWQPKDAQEVIRPAVEGTRRALEAAADAGLRRVVLTSSVVAVMHPPPPLRQDENDWADPDAPHATPYERSKTLAERAAWDLAARLGLELTTINPGLVLGPLLDAGSGSSVGIVTRMLKGRDPMVPDLWLPVVDVRDVALLHARALATPASAGERVIASGGDLSFPAMARTLRRAFPERRIPTLVAPKPLVALLSLLRPELRAFVPQLGVRREVANDKARRLFGLDAIPPEEALLATARSLLARGLA